MKRYAPNAIELASRDVVSRSEQTEIDEGRGVNGSVLLDLRHLGAERIIDRLPGSRELAMTYAGVDPIYEPIPVRPGAHYHMGGVETDNDGAHRARPASTRPARCACVSVHGANRLGGNSLMETITFGRRAGRAAAEWALANTTVDGARVGERDAERELKELLDRTRASGRGRSATSSASRCSRTSASSAARTRCSEQVEIIDELRERYERSCVEDKGDVFNSDLTQAIELGYLLDLAACMLQAGIARKESRGAHSRPHDYPARDDENFLKHSITRWKDGAPELSYKEVRFTKYLTRRGSTRNGDHDEEHVRCAVCRAPGLRAHGLWQRRGRARPGCGGGDEDQCRRVDADRDDDEDGLARVRRQACHVQDERHRREQAVRDDDADAGGRRGRPRQHRGPRRRARGVHASCLLPAGGASAEALDQGRSRTRPARIWASTWTR